MGCKQAQACYTARNENFHDPQESQQQERFRSFLTLFCHFKQKMCNLLVLEYTEYT